MLICTPLALLLMLTLYFVTTRILFPSHIQKSEAAHQHIQAELKKLGKLSVSEKKSTDHFYQYRFAVDTQRHHK